jgi:hypothetical protein
MSSHGWVCVHRQLLENPIFKNDKLFRVFMYCLLKASHSNHDQLVGDTIVPVKIGQFVSGRKKISSDTGLTEQNVRTSLSKLEKLCILTIKPTTKYSLISVANWDKYQQSNQQVTNSQPTSNQQVTTNNNGNNGKNGNNENKPLDQSKIDREKLEEDSFNFWWKHYPKKTAKKAAFKSWQKVIKKMDDQTVRDLTNHITDDVKHRMSDLESGSDKFIGFDRLHPTTYINNERYNDAY